LAARTDKLPARVALSGVTLLIGGCSRGHDYAWRWEIISPTTDQGRINFDYLVSGYVVTLQLASLALVFGVALGLLMMLLQRSQLPGLRALARGYVGILRAVPVFVLLLWIYYTLPILAQRLPNWAHRIPGMDLVTQLTPLTAAGLALALGSSAFLSEIFRAGVESIPKGQIEAALSLGMSHTQAMTRIVLPQALRRVLPPIAGQFIQTIKDSALASAIGLRELTRRATELQVQTYRPLEIYTFLALEYISIVLVLTWLLRRLERRMRLD
jgi:polar amino acid transport system permease protein